VVGVGQAERSPLPKAGEVVRSIEIDVDGSSHRAKRESKGGGRCVDRGSAGWTRHRGVCEFPRNPVRVVLVGDAVGWC